MKKIGILVVCMLCGLFLQAQQNTSFTINGTIKGKQTGFIYLGYTGKDGKPKQDSAAITNNTFKFSGELADPTSAFLTSSLSVRSADDPNLASIFIEPGVMQLNLTYGEFKNFELTGSKMQDDQNKLNKLKASVTAALKPYYDAYAAASAAYVKAKKEKLPDQEVETLHKKANDIRDQFEPFNQRMDKIDYDFFIKNPDSYITPYLMQFKVSSLPLDSVLLFYNNMSERVQKSGLGQRIAGEIVKLKKGAPGAIATTFSVPDINGKHLNLANLKGKYVLLDFWASWCVPCREGNPHLKKLYTQYKDKGFEIVGISDDDSAIDAWKKAVAQDGIGIWRHVLRGLKRTATGYDRTNDISENYGIHSLPTKILINRNGIIIGRYGGGGESDEAMDKKLAEVMNTK